MRYAPMPPTIERRRPLRRVMPLVAALFLIALLVGLRVTALDSDPYYRLSWSAALLTDEGFYIHNARNLILFGHERTDQWNNRLIMPTLHALQVWVFARWGVGAVQARMISVVLSLLTLLVFFDALRRSLGLRVAWIGTLFLGLDHVNLLYNRLALMDTPAALCMVCAFYAWVRAVERGTRQKGGRLLWLVACGMMLALTFVTRGLAAWLLPVPFALLGKELFRERNRRREWASAMGMLAFGLGCGLAIYLWLWYIPNHAEFARVDHYYLYRQLLPRNLTELKGNFSHALIGDSRGYSPYLFRHTPVQFTLTLVLLGAGLARALARVWKRWNQHQGIRGGSTKETRSEGIQGEGIGGEGGSHRLALGFLFGWLGMAWAVYALISYAPDRYYVLFYPAMAGLAALGLVSLPNLVRRLAVSPVRALLVGFLTYHAAEAVLHHKKDLLLALLVSAAVLGSYPWRMRRPRLPWREIHKWGVAAGCLLWGAVDLYWLVDWQRHLSYTQRNACRRLAENLPPDSVLIGDVAPGLCMDNGFRAISVIPGLCNATRPVETFGPGPRYIVILDERLRERYWMQNYPQYLRPENRVASFASIVHYPVGIYRVEDRGSTIHEK